MSTPTAVERPIIFSGPMVLAILSGRKTMTRRTRGLEEVNEEPGTWQAPRHGALNYKTADRFKGRFGATFMRDVTHDDGRKEIHVCPQIAPYTAGMRLLVKETWRYAEGDRTRAVYFADFKEGDPRLQCRRKSSIFMLRKFSRITLEVTAVRCERLQAITEADAKAEGFDFVGPCGCTGAVKIAWCREHGCGFAAGWDIINSKRPGCSWASNPWVWVVTFKQIAEA